MSETRTDIVFTGSDVVNATGGQYMGSVPADGISIRAVEIDDRRSGPNTLFVPIIGEKFDGHDFITRAMEAGSPLVLSDRPLNGIDPYVLVDDTLEALQQLAAKWKEMHAPFTVAITGSAGKTTTKEMVAAVLAQGMPIGKTNGNLNNQTGVPLTLFSLSSESRAAVIEMGMNHFGEIDRLARIVRPDIGIITNIGTAHVEHLGSRDGILKAKCEMLPYIQPNGFALVNGDDDFLRRLSGRPGVRTFGIEPGNDYWAEDIQPSGIDGTDAVLKSAQGRALMVRIPAPGTYMIYAALAAFACGEAVHMSDAQIAAGIASYTPAGSRMRITHMGNGVLLDDSYNANPPAVKEALKVLADAPGRTVAILGDMLELGEESDRLHGEIGAAAAAAADLVIGIGPHSKHTVHAAREKGAAAQWFPEQEKFLEYMDELCQADDSILVKGSRGMHLEKTTAMLLSRLDKTKKGNSEKGSEGDC